MVHIRERDPNQKTLRTAQRSEAAVQGGSIPTRRVSGERLCVGGYTRLSLQMIILVSATLICFLNIAKSLHLDSAGLSKCEFFQDAESMLN